MSIPFEVAGLLGFVWLMVALPSLAYLAEKKTETPALTMLFGFIGVFLPPLGLLIILALLMKSDISKGDEPTGGST